MKKLISKILLTLAGASLLILPNLSVAIAAQNSTAPRIDRYIQDSPNGLDGYSLRLALQQTPTINFNQLPSEAQSVIDKINKGGSFPYKKDGSVFGNVEGRLPQQERGWYHEYTVQTPGVKGRGQRRIISGKDGKFFYTPDHYKQFYLVR